MSPRGNSTVVTEKELFSSQSGPGIVSNTEASVTPSRNLTSSLKGTDRVAGMNLRLHEFNAKQGAD